MKVQWKRSLCLIFSLVMLLSIAEPIQFAYADDAQEGSVTWEPSDDLGAGEPVSSGILMETDAEDSLGDPGTAIHSEGQGEALELGAGEPQETSDTLPAPEGVEDAQDNDDGDGILLGSFESEDVTLLGNVSMSVSETPVKMKVGETKTITFTCKGVYKGCVISFSNSNPTAYTCTWGNWSGNKVTMRIQAHCRGSGRITVSLKSPSGGVLASGYVPVEISGSAVSISLSPSSVSPEIGKSKQVRVTIKNYSGAGSASFSIANGSVCGAKWGDWSGWTIPLTVTGKAGGSTKITISFKSSITDATLATATISVSVPVKASISASPTSVTLNKGKSATITIKTTGTVYSGDYLQWQNSNTNVCTVSWSSSWKNGSSSLVITGKSNGTATVKVYWKSSSGANRTDAPATISVTVKGDKSSISASPSSVTVNAGSTKSVTCTAYNVSGGYNFSYTNNNSSLFDCKWTGGWFGDSHALSITGKAAGTGTITVRLLQNDSEQARTTITVTVPGASGSPSYRFENYDDRQITLALAQKMFGNTQKAKSIYEAYNVKGGVCFGFATTSGLMFAPYAPYASNFGKSQIYDLQKTDYSSSLGYTVRNFIEAMHMTQSASSMKKKTGLSSMVSAVQEGGTIRPVVICIRGRTNDGEDAGHALLAYGTTFGGLKIYDPNWPTQERTLYVSGNAWSYEMWNGLTWGSGRPNAYIAYIPYSVYQDVWSHRGSLTAGEDAIEGGDYPVIEDTNLCLISTNAMDFTLRNFKGGAEGDIVARYEGGILLESISDDVIDVSVFSILPDGTSSYTVMLYVPEDYYFVTNNSETDDVVKMTLSGTELSVSVETRQKEFELAVSDLENTALALLSPGENEVYSISLGSSREGEPDETTLQGFGHGEAICLGATAEGLYVNNVAGDEGGISLGSLSDAKADGLTQDFQLNAMVLEETASITANASEGGSISPSGLVTLPIYGNQLYQIKPEEGYSLKALYVNRVKACHADEEAPPETPQYTAHDGVYEYYFQNARGVQEIYAEFSKNIEKCDIVISESNGEPAVTVTDPDSGYQLQDGYDYIVGLDDETDRPMLYVTALEEGGYYGMSAQLYGNNTENRIESAVYDKNANAIVVNVAHTHTAEIVAAAYDVSSGVILHYFDHQNIPQESAEAVTISLEGLNLPEKFNAKVFLLQDMNTARLLDWKPVVVDRTQ